MRRSSTRRAWAVVAVALGLGACGAGAPVAPDLGVPDGGALTPTAKIAATPDLVGFVTRLDGSGSRDPAGRALTYAWHFAAVPAGSQVVDASLSTASGPTPTFKPNRGGDYGVTLTVTTPDGVTGSAAATVTVPTLPLFYYRGSFGAESDTFSVGVVRSDGTGARDVICPMTAAAGDAGAGNLLNVLEIPGFFTMRVFNPLSGGGASRLAFEQVVPAGVDGSAAIERRLWLTDNHGDCAAQPPLRLDDGDDHEHVEPRFSPDGSRLAYLNRGAPNRLITVGKDGTGRHVVRSSAKIPGAAPVWVDGSHVAWAEDTSATAVPHLAIYSASDTDGAGDGAGRTTLLDCPAATDATALQVINQFKLAGSTLVIAGGVRSKLATPAGSINLYRMAAASCSTTAATRLASQLPGGDAWDFTIAPDGTTIAMSSTAGQTGPSPQHDILLLTVDGTLAPTVYAGSDPVLDDLGPRWLARRAAAHVDAGRAAGRRRHRAGRRNHDRQLERHARALAGAAGALADGPGAGGGRFEPRPLVLRSRRVRKRRGRRRARGPRRARRPRRARAPQAPALSRIASNASDRRPSHSSSSGMRNRSA